jgi:alkylation response protein AidB-like acyl-CoA dehydrogenase
MTSNLNPASITSDVVSVARDISPQIFAAREETEGQRQIPSALADSLAKAGLYQMYLPRSLGGPELPPLRVFEAIEEISKADGAVGWCLMNANLMALAAGWLKPEVGRQSFGQPPDLRAAGSLRPQGRAWPVNDGYRLKGQWNFASGIHNANWLFCPSVIMEGEAPRRGPGGTPITRTMWVPAGAAKLIDTWSVIGLRGTGSHDFTLDDIFVPEDHSISLVDPSNNQGPLYRPRFFFALAHLLFAANALGIARSAISTLVDMASKKATSMSTELLRDRASVQARVAQADAAVSAARCYIIDSLGRLWTAICENDADPGKQLGQLRLAIPHAIHEAVRATDLVFHTAGTNAIYTANMLERQFRDIHVAAQHGAAFPIHYESAGKVLMGLRPSEPGW